MMAEGSGARPTDMRVLAKLGVVLWSYGMLVDYASAGGMAGSMAKAVVVVVDEGGIWCARSRWKSLQYNEQPGEQQPSSRWVKL